MRYHVQRDATAMAPDVVVDDLLRRPNIEVAVLPELPCWRFMRHWEAGLATSDSNTVLSARRETVRLFDCRLVPSTEAGRSLSPVSSRWRGGRRAYRLGSGPEIGLSWGAARSEGCTRRGEPGKGGRERGDAGDVRARGGHVAPIGVVPHMTIRRYPGPARRPFRLG